MARILGILFVLGIGLGTCAASAQAGGPSSITPALVKRFNALSSDWSARMLKYTSQFPQDVPAQERNSLHAKGYDPIRDGRDGAAACTDVLRSSPQENFENLVATGNQAVAVLKAQELVYLAVGFAQRYNEHRGADLRNSKKLNHASVDGIDDAIRKLSGINALRHKPGQGVDWCAAFISVLSRLVDEEYPSLTKSQIWDSGDKSASFASARKLLADFDPTDWRNRGSKVKNSFLPPNVKPIPGCIAVYTNTSWFKHNGHVGLVVAVNGKNQMETIEGNTSPEPGSPERGIFEKTDRHWGNDQTVSSGSEKLQYRGCVLPWPGMANSRMYLSNACAGAVSQAIEKVLGGAAALANGGMGGSPSKAGTVW